MAVLVCKKFTIFPIKPPEMPLDMLSENVGVDETRTQNMVRKLRKQLNIKYVPDIRLETIGFMNFVVFVKFMDEKPDPEEVKKDLEKIPNVQLAAFTTGKYDMVMFVVAERDYHLGITEEIEKIKMVPSLLDIKSEWQVSFFSVAKSFIPLREEFFTVLEKRVWHRTKEQPRPSPNQLLNGEYLLLKELVKDGNMHFTDIEKNTGMPKGSARHRYNRLREKELLQRITIDIGANISYHALMLTRIQNHGQFLGTRKNALGFTIAEKEGNMIDRFSLVGNLDSPYGWLFIMPVTKINSAEATISVLNREVKGIKTEKLIMDKILFGRILHRRGDKQYSTQYLTLAKEHLIKPTDRRIYNENDFYRLKKINRNYIDT